jgi:ABC-2 type transport system permease protein
MKVVQIALVNLRRLMRDRVGLFFLFVFPMIIIITIGAVFGGGFTPKLGIVEAGGGPFTETLVDRLGDDDAIEIESIDDEPALRDAVERGRVEGGLIIPANYDVALDAGDVADVEFVTRAGSFSSFSLKSTVEAAVGDESALVRAARFAQATGGGAFAENLERAERVAALIPVVATEVSFAGEEQIDPDEGRFDFGAAQQLILFMFITSLNASVQLIQTRQLGIARRMISTPSSVRTVLLGETLGRFGVAMVQGLFIVAASAIAFGVDWGDPLATGLLIVLFALVGTGAAMLVGTLFGNEQQASSVGTFAGLALAALGGCMVPLELFSSTMQRVAHVTPHAWALDGLFDVMLDDKGVAEVLPEAGVLLAIAAALLTIATFRLRQAIVG